MHIAVTPVKKARGVNGGRGLAELAQNGGPSQYLTTTA